MGTPNNDQRLQFTITPLASDVEMYDYLAGLNKQRLSRNALMCAVLHQYILDLPPEIVEAYDVSRRAMDQEPLRRVVNG